MSFLKRHILFLILIPIIILSQIIILEPHLKYGFGDVDWGFLSIYKTENPYSPSQFLEFIKRGGTLGGVYTHQIYYIGIQNDFFGLNYRLFQLTTHAFRILAILSIFPLLLAIAGSTFVAFIATLFFGFSYSTVGTMYTVVTSSDYSAIFSMGIFAFFYCYMVQKNIGKWSHLILLLFLLTLTLFLSTERMYQLPFFIVLTEAFLFWRKGKLEKNMLKRLLIILLPLALILLVRPTIFLSYFLSHGVEIIQSVKQGNWNLLLTPLIALGSIVIPNDYVKFLGIPKIDSFGSFLEYIISGPLFVLVISTFIIVFFCFKKSHIVILQIFGLMLLFSVLLYVLASHFVSHQINIGAVTQALFGLYILAISIISFLYWNTYKERMIIGLFIGPFFAFIYIFLTWLGAATSEVFAGAHRYLTLPSLFISLFLGTLFGIVILKIKSLEKKLIFLKIILFTMMILLISFFIKLNIDEIQVFFNNQLNNGFGLADKELMRSQLNNYLDNLSSKNPSLFYFETVEDSVNGYYYDNSLLAGFQSWMLWHKNINFNKALTPNIFWDNLKLLKDSIVERNSKKLFLYRNVIYNLDDFYAFKLKDKKIIEIKSEVLTRLGI